jgi:low affinity Fe/Cu permease
VVLQNGEHDVGVDWKAHRLHAGARHGDRLGGYWSAVRIQRHVATVINTGTTIVTFLMVFLIHTQNRDTLALQVKLSELIVVMEKADNKFAAIEDATDDELEAAHEQVKNEANGNSNTGKAERRRARKARS